MSSLSDKSTTRPSGRFIGTCAGILAALAFAAMNLLVLVADGDLDAGVCLASRGLVGSLFLTPLVWREAAGVFSFRGWSLWVQCIFGALASLALFYNVNALGVGEAVALSYLAPIFVALVAPVIFRERLRVWQVAGVVTMVVASICLQMVHAPWRLSQATFIGFCGALSAAVSLLALKRAAQMHSAWLASWAFCVFSIITACAVIKPDALEQARGAWQLALSVGVLGTVGQICLSWSFKRLPAALAGALSLSTLIFSVLFESIYASRWPTSLQITGYTLMCFGLLLLQRAPRLRADHPVTS